VSIFKVSWKTRSKYATENSVVPIVSVKRLTNIRIMLLAGNNTRLVVLGPDVNKVFSFYVLIGSLNLTI
jgi:hypothetical protein